MALPSPFKSRQLDLHCSISSKLVFIFKASAMEKMEWCPEIALKSYLDTVKTCKSLQESNGAVAAELVSAMAGGSTARLIVEAWLPGGGVATSIGLAIACRHTRGRHVCVVADESTRVEYVEAMERAGFGDDTVEVLIGEADELLDAIPDVDFALVDCRRRDYFRFLRFLRLRPSGTVLVCKNAGYKTPGFKWRSVLRGGTRVLKSAFLPVGKGLEITQVAAVAAPPPSSKGRWITRIDRRTGEEHVFRR